MTLVVRGTVLDGRSDAALADGVVVVEGARIAAVGAAGEVAVPRGAEVIEGDHVVPGIVDAHNHLCLEMGDEEAQMTEPLPLVFLRACRRAEVELRAGITTFRSMGEIGELDVHYERARAAGLVSGPRLLKSLDALSRTGGHGGYFGREVDGIDGVRQAVRFNLKRGADVIKLMATGGGTTSTSHPTHPGFSLDELRVAVEEAHEMGKPVAVHGHGGVGVERALEAGVDSIEHGFYLDESLVRRMAEQGTWLVSTLGLVLPERSPDEDPRPLWYQRRLDEMRGRAREAMRLALEHGVRIAAGQDCDHGNMALEAECLVEVGMTPMQALQAVTRRGAEVCGLADELGTLEAGKLADLVVLGSDPLDDVGAALREVRLVVQEGQVVFRAG